MTEKLEFETEKGASRSKWVAIILVVALVGWMGSGMLTEDEAEPVAEAPRSEAAPVTVAVSHSRAELVTDVFLAEGQAEPERNTAIRSETGGTVAEVRAEKGDDVETGEVLARIDAAQREAELERARTETQRLERDLENVRTLLERGVATNDRLLQAESALASARAGLSAAEEAIGNLDIKAPFAGRIEALPLQDGEFIGAGTEVGRIVDLDPLTVTVQVPQQTVAMLEIGLPAEVTFITDERRKGEVSFIGSLANSDTRTFEAEIRVPNEGGEIPAGLSARVRIPTGDSYAHFLSPAILSLDTAGVLGVKTVNSDNTVEFYPVEILRAQTDGIWVTGLPDEITVITVGQGFVNDGEVVNPREADLLGADMARAEAIKQAAGENQAVADALSDAISEETGEGDVVLDDPADGTADQDAPDAQPEPAEQNP